MGVVVWYCHLRVASLLGCEIQKVKNYPIFQKIDSNLFPNHKLIYISPSLILYLVFFFFLRNVFGNTCYTQIIQIKISVFFFF